MKLTRAITIHNPHSWLAIAGWKPVENRTWASNYRGPLAIHASSNMSEIYDDELCRWLYGLHPGLAAMFDLPLLPGDDPKKPKISSIFHPGAILGGVEMFDCIGPFDPDRDDFEKLCRDAGHGKWYESFAIPPAEFAFGPYCHLYRDNREFTQPIPCKGALNIWHLKAPELAAVAAALKKPLGSPYHYRAKINTRKPALAK